MKISAVIVCVNYGDFLSYTLPQNKSLFDEVIIVTSTTDLYTHAVCEFNNVKCLKTDIFYENGASFNKAKGINAGLSALTKKDWILHMDADIWLPATFRIIIENLPLSKDSIYGIDRLMCPNYQSFQEFFVQQKPIHEAWVYQHMDFFPMGTRFIKYKEDGYIPLGFFQLFHREKYSLYPEEHQSAARTDLQFSMKWERKNRYLIPDVVGIHLESEERDDQSINWNGRRTVPFGPVPADFLFSRLPKDLLNEEAKKNIFWKFRNQAIY